MIIKEADDRSQAIETLNAFIADPRIPPTAIQRITKERNNLSTGIANEGQAAYQLNFDYGHSENYMVLHDLRFETEKGATQIDHVLINRFLEFYVLESKTYSNGVSINERGEFSMWAGRKLIGIASPIEQNNHHVTALKLLLNDLVMPERLGMSIKPTMKPFVLVGKTSNIKRPDKGNFNTDCVIKVDTFKTMLDDETKNTSFFSAVGSLAKVVSTGTIRQLAEQLAARHTPIETNYIGKFGLASCLAQPIEDLVVRPIANEAAVTSCPKCGSAMVQREAKRGANAGNTFWGCSTYPKCRGVVSSG